MTTDFTVRNLHQLQIMATKLQSDPSYMAWVINTYQKQERFSLSKLIEVLQVNEEILAKLALCKRPITNSKEFHKQVHQISEYINIEPFQLVKIIRQVESVITLSGKPDLNAGEIRNLAQLGVAAARDKIEDHSSDKTDYKEDDDDVAKQ